MSGRNDSKSPMSGPEVGVESSIALHLEPTNQDRPPEGKVEAVERDGRRWVPPAVDQSALRLKLDDVSQELLQARDALIGAESEAGVLRAKLTELDAQLQARDREIGELSAKLLALGTQPAGTGSSIQKAEAALRPVARQIKRAAKRRVSDR